MGYLSVNHGYYVSPYIQVVTGVNSLANHMQQFIFFGSRLLVASQLGCGVCGSNA